MADEQRSQGFAPQDDSWKTPSFRQSVVNKINEAILQSGVTSVKNSQEMENHVFQKSKTKDEYLSYVARLILHVREMNKSRNAPNIPQDPNQQNQQQQQNPQQQQQQQQGNNMMPDPINALQNLATQGTRMPTQGMQQMQGGQGQMQPNNLLQTLTQQRPMQGMAGMHQNMPIPQRPMGPQGQPGGMMGPQMSGGNMQMGGMAGGSQMPPNQQMGMGMMNIPPQMAMGQGMGPNQMQGGPMQAQMMPGQMGGMRQGGPIQHQMMNQQMGPGQGMNQMTMMMQGQIPRREMMQGPVPSPLQGMPTQMIPSPALVPSPSPQMIGSVRSQMPMMAPSPSAPLNTPGQPMRSGDTAPSPLNLHDEQIYREKYRQLTKYIEPLKKMINRMGDGDGDRLLKLKKLLEILSNPNSRIPLETLLKCEAALENQLGTVKEHTVNNPLLEAVSANIQNPLANHTLQRTFRPCLESLFGPDIRNLPPPIRRPKSPEKNEPVSGPVVSYILKREVASLDAKFKVTLDPSAQYGSKTIKLICTLDDKVLPCVPPINVTIPEDYPESLPECNILEQEYGTTDFLNNVQNALIARMAKLPQQYSLTHVLENWEMSVRQACGNSNAVNPNAISVLLNV